jgi:hypothetical protein
MISKIDKRRKWKNVNTEEGREELPEAEKLIEKSHR